VETYFALEDPTRIQPHGREELVEVTLPDGLLLRGLRRPARRRAQRRAAGGRLQDRVVPREAFEARRCSR
jgi:putative RecB family exonuclease